MKEEIKNKQKLIGNEIYCPIRGDLRDLYGLIHEISHTFDLSNGNTETRKIFGEVVPQCMERMLDDYLRNMSNEDLKKYGLKRTTLNQDTRDRQITTFLSRKDNIKSFNAQTGIREIDLRYILAELYSSAFLKLDKTKRIDSLNKFIKSVENNEIKSCKKFFGIDLENKLKVRFAIYDVIGNTENNFRQTLLQEREQNIQETIKNIIEKSKKDKNTKTELYGQNIHINLESKIPFILITPSKLQDDQSMVMESNNRETNNKEEMLLQALQTGKNLNYVFKGNNPILILLLPSNPNEPYYQQLSAECFQKGNRLDLDIMDTIQKAKEIMKEEYGVTVKDKIFLNGYSSSGCFAQRFSLIHPEIIDCACIGGASRKYSNSKYRFRLSIRYKKLQRII